jgi:hypothetical protein
MGWVGFAKRACARVSASSKWLNSSWIPGCGTGNIGSSATRKSNDNRPIDIAATERLDANAESRCSARENHALPSPGQANARATQITAKARIIQG